MAATTPTTPCWPPTPIRGRTYVNHRDPASRNATDTSTSIALLVPGTTPNGTAAVGSPARFGGCSHQPRWPRGAHGTSICPPSRIKPSATTPSKRTRRGTGQRGAIDSPLDQGRLQRHPHPQARQAVLAQRSAVHLGKSFQPEGAGNGWGGRMGDLLMGMNSSNSAANVDVIRRSSPA